MVLLGPVPCGGGSYFMPFSRNTASWDAGPDQSMPKYFASLGHALPQVNAQPSDALNAWSFVFEANTLHS